ncbi:Na+/H+ antiporter NhaA [Silvibacterium dinghuense]|uniref:Na(+)/H(+) antiporter NhaA n=1 Tax=Silvibacterium dinghuense TaxID=1560006 RepID=A0A4Q1SDP0_9BACT|nr:Na+/H+ antiporter NhaA [Silvibacterium dinghuense]RXS95223.1 Na+/H+ antiporter NhaA [Silvibacterium dinghuense]GGH11635.1 Na(+)/H(+) antiporter NhaA [Silvibacterium dinghuense]
MAVPERTLGALKLHVRESLIARTVQLPIQTFIHTQGVSSAFLLAAAVIALAWANSPWREAYFHAWHIEVSLSGLKLPIHAWINDAMMALFFFLVGMEIKQELVSGELRDLRRAALPVCGGLGGMIAPALIFALLNHGRPGAHGWGVPMATDIAFSLGVLTLIKGVPPELKIFLLSLAIADDIGAIGVIAIFYTSHLHLESLLIAALILVVILLCRRIGLGRQILYAALGFAFWLAVLRSGIHATIAGVILGFLMPVKAGISSADFSEIGSEMMTDLRSAQSSGDTARVHRILGAMEYLLTKTEAPADRITRKLHDWIAFLVLPLFALSNAGVTFSLSTLGTILHSSICWGVLLGLIVGKPLGILSVSWLATRAGLARLPASISWTQIAGVGVLAGIGFTVSLFISALAFDDPLQLDAAKTAILLASLIAGIVGFFLLKRAVPSDNPTSSTH